jgi:hypothetical protein
MDPRVLKSFARTLEAEWGEKLAKIPTSRTADGRELEAMTPASWKQTAKDLPLAIFVGGLGYGVGATGAHYLGKYILDKNKTKWLKYAPLALAAGGIATPYVQGIVREKLRERRERANAK